MTSNWELNVEFENWFSFVFNWHWIMTLIITKIWWKVRTIQTLLKKIAYWQPLRWQRIPLLSAALLHSVSYLLKKKCWLVGSTTSNRPFPPPVYKQARFRRYLTWWAIRVTSRCGCAREVTHTLQFQFSPLELINWGCDCFLSSIAMLNANW